MGINVWFLFQYCICTLGLPKLPCTFFWLDAKEPKVQDRIRSFGLTQTVYVLLAWCKSAKRSSNCLFFSIERKEPKVQGSHSGGYGLGRCAKISENSLRSDSRDFLTLRSVDRLTPPQLGQSFFCQDSVVNNGQLRMDNWKLFFHLPFINGTGSATVEAQRCCAS